MKKQYITPAIEAVDMLNCLPIANSQILSGGNASSVLGQDTEGDAKSDVEWDIWADD